MVVIGLSQLKNFYPRSPRGERPTAFSSKPLITVFLSTLPARGATCEIIGKGLAVLFLSTLPARGATFWRSSSWPASAFLSTLPARGATD